MSDLITRQAALNQIIAIETRIIPYAKARVYVDELKNYVIKIIEDLPSAEPERTAKVEKLGKRSETSMSWEGKCSNCGSYTIHEMNYCFECGAKLDWSE